MIRRPPRSTPLYSSAASDVYKRQPRERDESHHHTPDRGTSPHPRKDDGVPGHPNSARSTSPALAGTPRHAGGLRRTPLSLIHISEPTRLRRISYAVFC